MLKEEIPFEAMPVLREIRKLVPRPSLLPTLNCYSLLRWNDGQCPMGMLPYAKRVCPLERFDFEDGSALSKFTLDEAIGAFWEWFDRQDDASWVMDAIWPKGNQA